MAAGDAAATASAAEGADTAAAADVGLTLKLRQKLKEEQKNREKLEKRLQELESDKGSKGAEKQTADTIRLEELAVENGRMRDDLKKLRDALSDEAGEEYRYTK